MAKRCFEIMLDFVKRFKKRELGPKLYDRQKEVVFRETLSIRLWLENEILYSRPFDVIDRTHFIRNLLKNENISSEHSNNNYSSAKKIPPFIDFFNIDMSTFVEPNPMMYKTFNDFFIREIRDDRRPVAGPADNSVIACVADSRLSVFDTLQEAEQIMIKGKNFTLESLLTKRVDPGNEQDLAKAKDLFQIFSRSNCATANFRLAPMDYHHFHSPVDGVFTHVYHIEGEYFTVEPKALKSDINVLGENARTVSCIETNDHGKVLFIAIGAEAVGTVKFIKNEGDHVEKGEKLGHFEYGGSDVFVMFENPVSWDSDIMKMSKECVETMAHVREQIGIYSQDG